MYANAERLRLYTAKTNIRVSLTLWLGGTLSLRRKTAHILSYSKVKHVSFHAKQAQRGGRGIALPTLDPDTRKGWVISATLEPLYSRRRKPVPILQEAAWAFGDGLIGAGKSRYNLGMISGP